MCPEDLNGDVIQTIYKETPYMPISPEDLSGDECYIDMQ